jgi:hypothetical protein
MKKSDKAQEILNGFDEKITELEAKIDSPETEQTIREWLKFHAQFYRYSFRNTLWLCAQADERRYCIEKVASFNAWSEMKGVDGQKVTIKKGSKGFAILFPIQIKLYELDEKRNFLLDSNGRKIPMLDENGKQETITRYGVGYVFDVKQTTAKEVGAYQDLDYRGEQIPIDAELIKKIADRITEKYSIPVDFCKEPDQAAGGWYSRKTNSITVNLAVSSDNSQTLGTLFHELGHAVMHRDSTECRDIAEGQAEAFAYAASSVFGIERKSELYIKAWLDEDRSITDVMKNVSENVRTVFDDLKLHELAQEQYREYHQQEAMEMSA